MPRSEELVALMRQVTEAGVGEPYRTRIKQEAARRHSEEGIASAQALVAWALETLKPSSGGDHTPG